MDKKKKDEGGSALSQEEVELREALGIGGDGGGIQMINMDGTTEEEAERMIDEELARMEAEEQSKFVRDWKPGMRRRPLEVARRLEDFEEELNPDQSMKPWTLRDKRCGALAIKVGMMPLWDDWGERHAVTVLFLDHNVVVGHKTRDRHGYIAVQVGAGERKAKNVGRQILGQYRHLHDDGEKVGQHPTEEEKQHDEDGEGEEEEEEEEENDDDDEEEKARKDRNRWYAAPPNPPYLMREFRVTDEAWLLPIGSRLHARHFVPGQNVDISGITKGKGFQGAMKRHGFAGMPASHGVSKSHRALGSTGQCQDPGRVFKGKKMAGRMGSKRRTTQNLRILKIDRGRNLLYIKGAIPGNKGEFVEIRDAVKNPLWGTEKVSEGLKRPPLPTFPYDEETADGTGLVGLEEFFPMPPTDPFAPEVAAA